MTFLMLLIFSYNVIFLFVGTASLGLFLSSTFPSMLAYTEDILQYKGKCQRKHKSMLPAAGRHFLSCPQLAGVFQVWAFSLPGKSKHLLAWLGTAMFGHGCPVHGYVSYMCPRRPLGSLVASLSISFFLHDVAVLFMDLQLTNVGCHGIWSVT